VPSETDARRKVFVSRGPHPRYRADYQALNTAEVLQIASQICELCHNSVCFTRSSEAVPADSQVHCQVRCNPPVVLNEPVVVVVGVMAIGVSLVAGCGVN